MNDNGKNGGHFILIIIRIPDYLDWNLDAIPILVVRISVMWLRLAYVHMKAEHSATRPIYHLNTGLVRY